MSEEKEPTPSPEIPERNRRCLTLEDIKEALEKAFEGAHERLWANDAWSGLIKLGLTDYSNELERCEAAVRFIAFAGFYKDWLAQVEECDRVFDYEEVSTALNLTPFRLGQLIGRHSDFLDDSNFDPCTSLSSEEQLLRRAAFHLELEARPAIVTALMAHYGGISGLFVALWNSDKQPRPADYDQKWERYESERAWEIEHLHMWIPLYQDTDDEILNDVAGDKMSLWTWLDQDAIPLKRHWLDPEAKAALGDQNPAAVWSLVETLVSQAFEVYPDEAQKLMGKYQPPVDEEQLDLVLQHLDPVVGINNLVAINGLNFKNLLKENPPDVLEQVLFMVTLSDKWQREVSIWSLSSGGHSIDESPESSARQFWASLRRPAALCPCSPLPRPGFATTSPREREERQSVKRPHSPAAFPVASLWRVRSLCRRRPAPGLAPARTPPSRR